MNVSGAALALTETGAAAPVNVLVADDDPTSRVLVSAALEGHVRSVAEAENGLVAVQALEQQPFDLAILDLDMPVMDGFGVIERARMRPETRHLPIIVVTGRDDVVAIERAFALGATSFLCKPINWNIFRHQVGYVLQVARVERETRAAKELAERLAAFRARGLAALEQELASNAGAIAAASGDLPEKLAGVLETGLRLQAVLSRVRRTADILTGTEIIDQTIAKAGDLAEAAVGRVEAAFGREARGRIDLSVGEGLEVACDRAMAVEALHEVLDNALVFSPPAEKVRFAIVAAPGARVRFEIEDHGPGIPEQILERGFEGIGAGASGGAGRGLGLGLGLPMAKMIVERHGGHFAIMSEVGRGTEVFLSFPSRPAPMMVNRR